MPKIQLIRRDSQILELDAEEISFSFQRMVAIHPLPALGTRAALDMNQTTIGIRVSGILTNDEEAVSGAGSSMSMDLSIGLGSTLGGTTYFASVGSPTVANLRNGLLGKEIVLRSKGQIDANLNEKIVIRFVQSPTTNILGTETIIQVGLGTQTTTEAIVTSINTTLAAGSALVGGAVTPINSIFSISQSKGQADAISYLQQNGNAGTFSSGEMLTLTNIVEGESGNTNVSAQIRNTVTLPASEWSNPFFFSNFSGGIAQTKMSRGDKLQDLINMVSNSSAGGALISPQVLTGSLIDLPDSIASLDAAQFLRISESKTVQKYIVGIRIPYESFLSTVSGQSLLKQFVIPAGPGADFSAASNTTQFDPVETVNDKKVRPNPFLQQGVAIPAIITAFDPSYEAGDSVWNYEMQLAAVESLVGI